MSVERTSEQDLLTHSLDTPNSLEMMEEGKEHNGEKRIENEKINNHDVIVVSGNGNPITFNLLVSIFGVLCGCAFNMGYNTGVINPPQALIQSFMKEAKRDRTGTSFTTNGLNWYWSTCVSSYFLAAPLGCILASWSVSKFGRKFSMGANVLLLFLGCAIQTMCKTFNSYEMFLLGRIITGINNGACTVLCPTYLAEIAPKQIRGGIGALFQLSVISGVVISFIFGFQSLLGNTNMWPYLFVVPAVFGLIHLLLLPFCVESPRYILLQLDDYNKCKESLRKLRHSNFDIEEEIREILSENQTSTIQSPSWLAFLTQNNLRRPLFVAIVITISQQFCGVNSFTAYSAPLLNSALPSSLVENSPDFPNYVIVGTGMVSFTFTAISVQLIDKIGRKKSHLIGLFGMAVCLLFVSFIFSDLEVSDNQKCFGIHFASWSNYVAIVFMFIYIAFFGIGPAAVPWLITPELFPDNARPRGVSIVTTINWLCNFSVVFGFVPLQEAICGWVFLIFFVITVVCFLYLYFKLPEVKGGDAIIDVIVAFDAEV